MIHVIPPAMTDAEYIRAVAALYSGSLVPEIKAHHERLMQIAKNIEDAERDNRQMDAELRGDNL